LRIVKSNDLYDVEDLSEGGQFYLNDESMLSKAFTLSNEGIYFVHATLGDRTSEKIKIEVRKQVVYDSISIPVIFHVLAKRSFSAEQAVEKISALNRGFAGLQRPGHPNLVDSNIHFRLAVRDALGNTLEEAGIARHPDVQSLNDASLASSLMWDPNKYLNLFLFEERELNLGQLPPTFENSQDCIYSVIVDPDMSWDDFHAEHKTYYYGSLLESTSSYFLIHEIGHNFGLLHSHEGCVECMPHDVLSYRENVKFVYRNRELGFATCDVPARYVIPEHVMDSNARIERFTFGQIMIMRYNLEHRPWIKNLKYSDR
jgi:hypothetical protein